MAGVAWRNRVFGGTLKLRDYHATGENATGTSAILLPRPQIPDRVVVMLISHLPNRTPSHPAQSDPSSSPLPPPPPPPVISNFLIFKISTEGVDSISILTRVSEYEYIIPK